MVVPSTPTPPPQSARTSVDVESPSDDPFSSPSDYSVADVEPHVSFGTNPEAGPSRPAPVPETNAEAGPSRLGPSLDNNTSSNDAQGTTELDPDPDTSLPREPVEPWINGQTTSLHQAVLSGDLQLIEENLDGGASINLTDRNNMTPLHLVCSQKIHPYPHVVEFLLQRGVHINAVDRNNWTALLYATHYGYGQIVLILLEHGASLSYMTTHRWTALHMTDKLEIAEYLLNFGANVNCLDLYGRTPLSIAAARGSLPLVRLLLQHEAKANKKDNYLSNALTHCILGGDHPDMARVLLFNGVKPDDVDIYGYTSLHHAAAYERPGIATLLLDSGAAVDTAANWLGWPNDMVMSRLPMAELLDRQGGKSNFGGGMTPVHVAAFAGSASTLRVLLDKGKAPVDQLSRENMTALHYCSQGEDHVETARVLVEHEADVNVKGYHKKTPLHFAAAAGRRELAEYLMDNGADVTASTTSGMTPAQMAMANGHKALHAALLARDKRSPIVKMRDAVRNEMNSYSRTSEKRYQTLS